MKLHLATWIETDTGKVTVACGQNNSKLWEYKKEFLRAAQTRPQTLCEKCKRIYDRKPW